MKRQIARLITTTAAAAGLLLAGAPASGNVTAIKDPPPAVVQTLDTPSQAPAPVTPPVTDGTRIALPLKLAPGRSAQQVTPPLASTTGVRPVMVPSPGDPWPT